VLHARQDYNERIQDSAGLIPEDEPVFLLRAQDVCARAALRTWIQEAMSLNANEDIIQAARDQLDRFGHWRDIHPAKIPDLPK
jgi:hypothetical protein